jgi:predicted nucleic acid-binding protein
MKVLLDTNILLDVIEKRGVFFLDSYKVYIRTAAGKMESIIGASSVTDIYYVIRKNSKDPPMALNAIRDLLEVVTLVDTKAEDIQAAIKLGFSDFEDAVVCATAAREQVNYIITRNMADFANSPVKAITPGEFMVLPEIAKDEGTTDD